MQRLGTDPQEALQQGQPAQPPKLTSEKGWDGKTIQDFSCLCGIGPGGMAHPVGKHHLPAEPFCGPVGSVIPVGRRRRSKHLDAAQDLSPHLCACLAHTAAC